MPKARTTGQETVLHILGGTADDYDRVVAESTGNWDKHWKRWMLKRMEEPKQVLDLASGTGILSFMVTDAFPDAHLTGVDLQEDYQAVAIERSKRRGLSDRTTWHRAAVEDVELSDGVYDHVISCYLPKYADRPVLVERLARWCAPGARVILHDFAHPTDERVERVLKQRHDQWLTKVRKERPHWISCFEDLYDIVKESTWTADLPPLLEAAGFEDVELHVLSYGCSAVATARRPSA